MAEIKVGAMTDEQRAAVESIREAMADPDGIMLGGDVVILLAALDAVEAENAALRAQRSGAPWLGIYRTPQEMADALVSMRADLAKAAHWAEHGPNNEAPRNAPSPSNERRSGDVTSAEVRARRKFLAAENKKWPATMTEIPREEWPGCYAGTVVNAWRSAWFFAALHLDAHRYRRLSVNRTQIDDRGQWVDGLNWDDLMLIKRQCGFGADHAVEVYPSDADVVNVANMRHLWILDAPLPFVWKMRESQDAPHTPQEAE